MPFEQWLKASRQEARIDNTPETYIFEPTAYEIARAKADKPQRAPKPRKFDHYVYHRITVGDGDSFIFRHRMDKRGKPLSSDGTLVARMQDREQAIAETARLNQEAKL